MGGLSRWAVRKPWWALGAFALLAVVVFTLGGKFGGDLNDSFSLPDTSPRPRPTCSRRCRTTTSTRRPRRSSGRPRPRAPRRSTSGGRDDRPPADDRVGAPRRRLRHQPVRPDRRRPRDQLPQGREPVRQPHPGPAGGAEARDRRQRQGHLTGEPQRSRRLLHHHLHRFR